MIKKILLFLSIFFYTSAALTFETTAKQMLNSFQKRANDIYKS